MTAPRPRRWFQIHLSTAVVLMFAAGGLIWANVPRHEIRVETIYSDTSESIGWFYQDHDIPMDQPLERRTESETCGWPIQWQNQGDVTAHGEMLEAWGRVATWRTYVYDGASWLGILLLVTFACECLARCRDKKQFGV